MKHVETAAVVAALVLAMMVMLMMLVGHAGAAEAEDDTRPVAFRPWQRVWQCNDIRVTETVARRGVVTYDLGGMIWGGSRFTLDLQNGTLWFNDRPCAFLGGTQ